MNVLIADDETLQRDLLTQMVSRWGHTVTVAADAAYALELARSRPFDLFILDVYLPDMTGMELIPLVKELQPEARIITMTGASSRTLEGRLRELGISYYMAKPFQRQELESLLEHIASRAGVSRESAGAKPAGVPTDRASANGSRRHHCSSRCGSERKGSR